eukprot:gene19466-biopygen10036
MMWYTPLVRRGIGFSSPGASVGSFRVFVDLYSGTNSNLPERSVSAKGPGFVMGGGGTALRASANMDEFPLWCFKSAGGDEEEQE